MYFLTLQHSKANQIIVCINLRKLILFIFFILHNVRGNRILLFCNFDNCLSRKMVVVCNDFQRKQKLKKFIILNSYEKMDVCITTVRKRSKRDNSCVMTRWLANVSIWQLYLYTKHETRARSQSSWIRIKYKLSNIGRPFIYNTLQKW